MIGVTERQAFYGQMRDLARRVALAYLEQRKEQEYPLLKQTTGGRPQTTVKAVSPIVSRPSSFIFEIGVEELPASDVDTAYEQLNQRIPSLLNELHLDNGDIRVFTTPRRLVVSVEALSPRQPDREDLVKGPAADKAC